MWVQGTRWGGSAGWLGLGRGGSDWGISQIHSTMLPGFGLNCKIFFISPFVGLCNCVISCISPNVLFLLSGLSLVSVGFLHLSIHMRVRCTYAEMLYYYTRMLQTGKESLPDDESYALLIGMLFQTEQIDAAFEIC